MRPMPTHDASWSRTDIERIRAEASSRPADFGSPRAKSHRNSIFSRSTTSHDEPVFPRRAAERTWEDAFKYHEAATHHQHQPDSMTAHLTQTMKAYWKPGTLRSAPMAALLSILLVIGCAVAIVVVLCSANHKATAEWPSPDRPIQLAVILSALVTIGNAALAFAHVEGVGISWWVRMLKGCDLSSSHRHWEHGSSAWKSIIHVRHFGKASLASLSLAIALTAGPLLQRAAIIVPSPVRTFGTFPLAVSSEDFQQPTAYYLSHVPEVSTLSLNFSSVLQDFTAKKAIPANVQECHNVCSGTVVGAGFDTQCETTTVPYNLSSLKIGSSAEVAAIDISSALTFNAGVITISTLFKPTAAPSGSLTKHTCTLHAAKVRYPITFTNTSLTLLPFDSSVNHTVAWQYPPTELAGLGRSRSHIGGFYMALNNLFGSIVELRYAGEYAIQGNGTMRYSYMTSNDSAIGTQAVSWMDPMPFVLDAARELAFRTTVAFSNSSSHQIVAGFQDAIVNKYVLRVEYLIVAIVVMFVAVLSVTWLFDEFWILGRKVSMSPLEIAKAFQAPITANASSNSEVDVLLKQIGGRSVQYGALQPERMDDDVKWSSGRSLAVAPPSHVSPPSKRQSLA